MGLEGLGPWEPLSVAEVVAELATAPFRWWLSGGHALEAHLGRSWRSHDDIDIGITRSDAPQVRHVLDGWDIHLASDGALTRWDGESLDDRSDHAGNNLWCRPSPDDPWRLDVLIGDGDQHQWIYRRDPSIRRSWADTVLTSADGIPYLAPELQMLFKSKGLRQKDDADAASVIPELEPERRTWLAQHLAADHPWQNIVAGERARQAINAMSGRDHQVALIAAGRSSQAWTTVDGGQAWVIKVPVPNSGRVVRYRSEVLIGDLLAGAGHPVSRWNLHVTDGVECSIGTMLAGKPIEYGTDWSPSFVEAMAALLRDLHNLPATGWGPLENRSDDLRGTSPAATDGIVDRWFHASIWPFDESDLAAHPIALLEPDLAPVLTERRNEILDAVSGPAGIVHSDLHHQHLLHVDDELTGLLDFGDAFIGSTAWDLALIHWYYGSGNAKRVADAYGSDGTMDERGSALAIAVGCYKVAKTPDDGATRARLRSLLTA